MFTLTFLPISSKPIVIEAFVGVIGEKSFFKRD